VQHPKRLFNVNFMTLFSMLILFGPDSVDIHFTINHIEYVYSQFGLQLIRLNVYSLLMELVYSRRVTHIFKILGHLCLQ